MTVLPDHEILALGPSAIEPFDPAQVQPASYDIRLGETFRVFLPHRTDIVDLDDQRSWEHLSEEKRVPNGKSFTLQPHQFALGRSIERFTVPANIAVRLEGKSSLARLALAIHVTGGFVDPGFCGTITLEFVNLLPVPIKMWPGQKIGQVCFMEMGSPAQYPYGSNVDRANRYQGQTAATPSRFTT